MPFFRTGLLSLLIAVGFNLTVSGTVTNCAPHTRFVMAQQSSDDVIPFDIRATASAINIDGRDTFAIQDGSGFALLRPKIPIDIRAKPGDDIRISGYLQRNKFAETISYPTNVSVLSHGPPPSPASVSITDIKTGRYANRLVSITGVVRNFFADDVDPDYRFLVLADNREIAYVVLGGVQNAQIDSLSLLGATVSVTGVSAISPALLPKHERRIWS